MADRIVDRIGCVSMKSSVAIFGRETRNPEKQRLNGFTVATALLKDEEKQRPTSQCPVRLEPVNRGRPEHVRLLSMTVIPTARIIQQRGEMQDTILRTAGRGTYLVRQHTDPMYAACPLSNFDVRRLDGAAPKRCLHVWAR
jgi:hypothetical protein